MSNQNNIKWDFNNPANNQEEVYFLDGKEQIRYRYKLINSDVYSVQDLASPKVVKTRVFDFKVGKLTIKQTKWLLGLFLCVLLGLYPVAFLSVLFAVVIWSTLSGQGQPAPAVLPSESVKAISQKKYKEGVAYRMQFLKQFQGKV